MDKSLATREWLDWLKSVRLLPANRASRAQHELPLDCFCFTTPRTPKRTLRIQYFALLALNYLNSLIAHLTNQWGSEGSSTTCAVATCSVCFPVHFKERRESRTDPRLFSGLFGHASQPRFWPLSGRFPALWHSTSKKSSESIEVSSARIALSFFPKPSGGALRRSVSLVGSLLRFHSRTCIVLVLRSV